MYPTFAALFLTFSILSLEARTLHPKSSTPFPIPEHKASGIFKKERTLTLEDGSQWDIPAIDTRTLSTWRTGDTLSILPNYKWFNACEYLLVNETNHSEIEANLAAGPSLFNPACYWIINMEENHIFLQNGMIWCVNPQDEFVLKYWAVNDPIILGKEDSAWTHYPHILINVNTNDFVRASLASY